MQVALVLEEIQMPPGPFNAVMHIAFARPSHEMALVVVQVQVQLLARFTSHLFRLGYKPRFNKTQAQLENQFVVHGPKIRPGRHSPTQNNIDPDKLTFTERVRLLKLGTDVLETEVLAKYGMRSYERYEHFELTQAAIKEIESALNVSQNTSRILTLEKVAAVQPLSSARNMSVDEILKLRNNSDVKHYRKWINEVSVDTNESDIAPAYISAVQGSSNPFSSTGGKLLKTLAMFAVGNTVSAAIAGAAGLASQLGLSLFDSFIFENIIRGYNPRLFVERIKREAAPREE